MQNAPKMKGSGLNPEPFKTDEVVHVFGTNIKEKIDEENPISFDIVPNRDTKQEDDIESIKKRKFDARTGEEDEETVFQGDFKLFSWDLPTSNWIEKGRGQLKLNDSLDEHSPGSRLIMRLSGTLRIILNVAIRHRTFRVINNTKTSIRFTDSQTVWAASGNNANQLRELIEERVMDGKRLKSGDLSSESAEPDVVASKPIDTDTKTTDKTSASTDPRSEDEAETKNRTETEPDSKEGAESETSASDPESESEAHNQTGSSTTKDKTEIEDKLTSDKDKDDGSKEDQNTDTSVIDQPKSTSDSPTDTGSENQTEAVSTEQPEQETKEDSKEESTDKTV